MVGLLFIVNVPRKEYEEVLRKKENPQFVIENEKFEKASEIVRELKENKKFSSLISSVNSINHDDNSITKCKSTDCLHREGQVSALYKSRSETTLNNNVRVSGECKSNTSWEDIKQVIKPRKNKLKISRPVRGVDILGAFHWDTPLETVSVLNCVYISYNNMII